MDILSFLATYAIPLFAIGSALCGAFVGGLIGRSNDKQKRIAELKREVLLESLDNAYEFEDAMRDFTTNASLGGSDPEADAAGAAALERALELNKEMRRLRGRVAVVGSQAIVDSFGAFQTATDTFMDECARQINTDGIFRGEEAQKFHKEYAQALDKYVNRTRRELGIRRSVNAKNERRTDAVQVEALSQAQ
ncbi:MULTISPECIES: hypothetical protein [Microbacterium]|uniref:hypothetical protein n=1 Tax=Microbacterium TaxID=33882 RepID=UPI00076776C0|nr:hypothetical protein [Microbacterium paraoxydans]